MPLQIRRGTNAERLAMTQALAQGELLYVTDDQRLYIGNGTTLGGVQITGYTDGDAKDAAAAAFTGGSHSGINFSYNTATDIITATVDLSGYTGTINASSFKGTLVADDSTLLVDAVDAKINLDGTVKGNIIPNSNDTYDIGSASYRFKDLYLSGSSIRLGNATITSSGTTIDLPAGSTIAGEIIAITSGSNYNINIVGDDSTVIVNSATKVITGSLTGNVTGNVTGNLTGNTLGYHTGDVTGSIFADDSTIFIDSIDKRISANNIYADYLQLDDSVTSRAGIKISTNSSGADDVDLFNINTYHSNALAIGSFFSRGRGTIASPAAIQNGDIIYNIGFSAVTTDGNQAPVVLMNAVIDDTVGAGIAPGRFNLYTSDASGTSTLALSIDSDQLIQVASNTVTAGGGSGQANTGSVATYLKIKIGSTEYAIPAYAINP